MKGDTEVVLMVAFFFGGAAMMAYAEDISATPFIDAVLTSTTTLVAAFFGAKYAFKLQLINHEQRMVKEQVEAGNKAIFELVRTYNQFYAIRNQLIDQHRQNPGRHLLILPMIGNIHVIQLNFDDLAFMFDSKDPNLLGRLAMFQQEVATTIDAIVQRSQFHVEFIQAAAERIEDQTKGLIYLDQLEKELGNRNTHTVKMLTDAVVSGVDKVILDAEKLTNELNTILEEVFPRHRIIKMIAPNGKNASPTL